MTVGERIRQARLKKGYSQAELAELLGYKSRSSINKIEVGEREVPRNSVKKFAEILEVPPSYLMGFDEDDDPDLVALKLAEGLPKLSPKAIAELKKILSEMAEEGE